MTTYDFDDKLAEGEGYEREIDALFESGFYISPATQEEQRRGIDRHYTSKLSGQHFTIEYKGDTRASETGNAFVETVSVDATNKPGWAYTSEAHYIFYYLPGQILYILTSRKLRNRLARWEKQYPLRSVLNNGYRTIGVLIPLDEFERYSVARVNL